MRSKISKLSLFKFAKVIKPHSYKGDIVLKLEIDFERIKKTELMFVEIDGIKVPFFIDDTFIPFKKNSAIIKLDSVENELEVKRIVNCSVFIEQEYIIPEIENPFSNVKGYKIFNNEIYIGTAEALLNIPSNPILQVLTDKKREILIPINEDFIESFNKEDRSIYFSLPKGLIEIYD